MQCLPQEEMIYCKDNLIKCLLIFHFLNISEEFQVYYFKVVIEIYGSNTNSGYVKLT